MLYINHSKKLTIWLWTLLFRQSSRLQDHGKTLTWSVFELQSIKTQGPKYFHSVQTFFLTLKFLFGYTKTNLPAVLVISSIYKNSQNPTFAHLAKKANSTMSPQNYIHYIWHAQFAYNKRWAILHGGLLLTEVTPLINQRLCSPFLALW